MKNSSSISDNRDKVIDLKDLDEDQGNVDDSEFKDALCEVQYDVSFISSRRLFHQSLT